MRGEELFHEGLILRDLHRFKAAAKVFHEVRILNPDFSEAWFWEAVSHDNSGNEMDAIPCYLEAIRLGVSDELLPRAFLWLSSSYSRVGDCGQSEKYLKMAEENGNYQPKEEYELLSNKIRKRNERNEKLKKDEI